MCGITGFVYLEPRDPQRSLDAETAIIRSMCDSIAHRGPDAEGYHIDDRAVLGSRRLSIIDLTEKGNQPLYNEDGTVAVIMNGEIYNFAELRSRLDDLHSFRSKTDTEVVAHAYEAWGMGFLSKLNGDFAICIWDKRIQKLYICVDRFSVKHLYYGIAGTEFVFGSELKAVLRHPRVMREINPYAVQFYLVFGYLPDELSIFRNIRRLRAGTYLECDVSSRRVVCFPYYNLDDSPSGIIRVPPSRGELIDAFRKSIGRRLVGDVPIGLFLSSGIDSSSILRFMRDFYEGPIHTFTVGYTTNNNEDELEDAAKYALQMGGLVHTFRYSLDDLVVALGEVCKYIDEPFADISIIPTYLISREASKTLKVVLSGDGADELLGGYETYVADKYLKTLGPIADLLISPLRAILERLPGTYGKDVNPLFVLTQLTKSKNKNPYVRHYLMKSAFSPDELNSLLAREYRVDVRKIMDPIRNQPERMGNSDFLNSIMKSDILLSLQSDMLMKVDCASMANGLEVRVPFLDHEFVELALRIPGEMKVHGFERKAAWKKALTGELPPEILSRKKLGFGVPVKPLLDKLRPMIETLLAEECLDRQGIFKAETVRKIVRDHFENGRDRRKKVWALFMFQIWYFNTVDTSVDLRALFAKSLGRETISCPTSM